MRGFYRIMDALNKVAALINLPILHDMGCCNEFLMLWTFRTGGNHHFFPSTVGATEASFLCLVFVQR
jgi:hypothetical protein